MFVTSAYAQEAAPAAPPAPGPATDPAPAAPAAAPAAPAAVAPAPESGELHTETGTAHEGAAHGVFPPFDQSTYASSLLWLVITFVIFYLVMQKAVVPRVGSVIENRRARISSDLEEAGRLKAEADAAVATYEAELAEARAKAGAIATAARDAAKAKAEADRRVIEADLSAKLKEAEARIAEVKTRAFADVGTIAEETATAVVEQLIGARGVEAEVAAAVAARKGA